MPKILFIAAHRPDRSPSQRFRFEQYFSFLRQNGFDCYLSHLLSEEDDKIFYRPGNFHIKIFIFLNSVRKRWKDARRAKEYDIIFVQREAFMIWSIFFEKKFKKSGAKLVFDFDDAIWHFDISDANRKFGWLKNPGKTPQIIGMCDLIFSGNRYLADYAKLHNKNVVIIPTTVDTHKYQKSTRPVCDDQICIGWSGSLTTIKHFEYAVPFLKRLKQKYGQRLVIKVIGDASYENAELGVKGIAWCKEKEVEALSSFHIGLMPLPDNEWSKGKCGLKALLYMSLEIPAVVSPVGVNSEIISDGVNGFLAHTEEEWIDKISLLVENPELRTKLGAEARRTVVEKYSVDSQKEQYLNNLKSLLS